MPENSQIVSLRPSAFVPTTSFTGAEERYLLRAENLWLRIGRFGTVYAECYKGSTDISEAIPQKTLMGTIAWTSGSDVVTGTGTDFVEHLHLGSFVFADSELFVVEFITSATSFICSRPPTTTFSGKTAYVLPVLYAIGTKRGTQFRGNTLQFPKGHFLTVGDGEVKINGASLSSTLTASRTPRFAIFDPVTNTYTQSDVGIVLPTYAATPYISLATGAAGTKGMLAGNYGIRVVAKNTKTNGYSNPADNVKITGHTAGNKIAITFNYAMTAKQDAWDIYVTEFKDYATTTISSADNGPWYLLQTITAAQLIDGGHPTGRETGTTYSVEWNDGEVRASLNLISFNNFAPKEAEFVDITNGIPIYFSCLGRTTAGNLDGRSPGAVAIPSKPSNVEAVFLNKAITTARADTIIGEVNARGRMYALCQNSLQTLILTSLDDEPITFRSDWDAGFRNPYNVAFIKNYLYGFSTSKLVRSVAGGDDSSTDVDFALDVEDFVRLWMAGHILVAYDPRNSAVCFFYAAAEKRSGHWVTICLPFLWRRNVWNPPIIIQRSDRDMIVSGVATIGNDLYFLAGGKVDGGTFSTRTYRFDGGDSEAKAWYAAWNYSDEGQEITPKSIGGISTTGRFTNGELEIHGVQIDGDFDVDSTLKTGYGGTEPEKVLTIGTNANLRRARHKSVEWDNYSLWTVRVKGSCTDGLDRLDEVAVELELNATDN